MIIEFLGTGGAAATPIPGATDPTSIKARTIGAPYSRYGPCIYVHGPELMIDTPEEARLAMERAGLARVPHCVYSHWHPDHTFGRRIFEFNRDFGRFPGQNYCTQVYLPDTVANSNDNLGLQNSLNWYARWGWVKVHTLKNDAAFELNGVQIKPIVVTPDLACGFLLTEGHKRALIVPDEVHGWQPPACVRGVDVAVMPAGIMPTNLFSGASRWDLAHPVFRFEPTFDDVLGMIAQIQPKRVFITHLEANDMPDYDQLRTVAARLTASGKYGELTFAWDTLSVEVD